MSAGMIDRECVICNAAFKVWPSRLKKPNGGITCSMRCSIISRGLTLSAASPLASCGQCGKVFRVKASHLARSPNKTCSRACAARALRQKVNSAAGESFWARVNRYGPIARPGLTPCMLWIGTVAPDSGYGLFRYDGEQVRAHRFAWFLAEGRWPDPCALHRCDVRHCVNREHLFEGDLVDNCADRHAKERDNRGEDRWSARLTEAQVIEIRRRAPATKAERLPMLLEFGITDRHLRGILAGKCWKFLLTPRAS